MRSIVITGAVWAALWTTAAARDIFVDNVNGDDRNSGASAVQQGRAGGPYRSIARALRAASKGDRVVIANTGQPYRESLSLGGANHSGFSNRPFVIEGNGAILDGVAPVPLDCWKHFRGDVFCFEPGRGDFQQLFLGDKPAERAAVPSDATVAPELAPLQWRLVDGRIYFCVEQGRLPQSYDLFYTDKTAGITLYQVRNVEIRDLVVQGFLLDGVNAHDGVVQTTLVGLTCRGNGRSGISVGGASHVLVQACLVGNNGAAQVRGESYSTTQFDNCELLDNTAPPIVRDGENARLEQLKQQ